MHWALGCATHDLLVPVPLHPSHLSSRQYNQAGLLAAEITRLRALPLVHALTKHKQPQSQTTLDREQRLKALAGAFRAARGASRLVRDARVLLVDDVFTTGATAHACACVLLEMGALRVDVAVAAAGIPFESAAKRGVLSPR
jgi:predicted amidophosphoribosyltransferase